MYLAVKNGVKVSASRKGEVALCPLCRTEVFARFAKERIPHWVHKTKSACAPWSEAVTGWHLDLYRAFGALECKVDEPIMVGDQKHLADVVTPSGNIIQLRSSPISTQTREENEAFFDPLTWFVRIHSKKYLKRFLQKLNSDHVVPGNDLKVESQKNVNSVFWFYQIDEIFPKSWCSTRVPIIFDFSIISQYPELAHPRYPYLFWYLIPGFCHDFSMFRGFRKEDLIERLVRKPFKTNQQMSNSLEIYLRNHPGLDKRLLEKSLSLFEKRSIKNEPRKNKGTNRS